MSDSPPNSIPPPGAEPLWGSYEGGAPVPSGQAEQATLLPQGKQNRHSPGGNDLDPLSRRLLQVAGALSLLLILVVANAFLHSSENPLNPVAAAAERTQDVRGMRFTMKITTTSEAKPPETAGGSGAYNAETGLAEATFHLPTDQGRIDVDSVMEDSAVYVRSPQFPQKFPEGKEWLKVEPLSGESSDNTMPGEGPESSLRMLSASGGVHPLGQKRVRGVATKRYAADIEMGALAGQLRAEGEDELAENCEQLAPQVAGPMHVEAFIAEDGILRRMRIAMTTTVEGVQTTDMRMDFFDFGVHPEIQVPDESRVFDMSQLQEQLEAFGESS